MLQMIVGERCFVRWLHKKRMSEVGSFLSEVGSFLSEVGMVARKSVPSI